MLAGKELILATKPFAKEIRWKSWYYSLSTMCILSALLLGTHFVPVFIGRLVCSIAAGLVIIRLFVIYHDHQHHAILHKSLLADILFKIFGVYVLAPSSIWKRSHDYHHNHNSKLFSAAALAPYPIMTYEKPFKESTCR